MYVIRMENMMVNYNKLMEKLKEKNITTYVIRQPLPILIIERGRYMEI